MIVANGAPKSGTHALMALLHLEGRRRVPGILYRLETEDRLVLRATVADREPMALEAALALDDGWYVHAHVCDDAWLAGQARVITMLRDPRDILVSYRRWHDPNRPNADRLPAGDAGLVASIGAYFNRPLVRVVRGFLGWRALAETRRFTELPLQRTAGVSVYAGCGHDPSSETDRHSDWREHWTPAVHDAWAAAGGPALVREMGYAD